jgi:PIN domain nuclease of toxin-antitoxin system
MNLLLDTHIWLWAFREPHKLSSDVHRALGDPTNIRFLSPVSIWEVLILLEKRRIKLEEDFARWFARTATDLELAEAPLNWKAVHEMRYKLPNHRDPGDRFLAATAIAHDLTLVTADARLFEVPGLKVFANV